MSRQSPPTIQAQGSPRRFIVNVLLVATGLLLVLLVWKFREPIRGEIIRRGTRANNSPRAALVLEMIHTAPVPAPGRPVHSRLAPPSGSG